jgi:hypothetical protein
MIICLVGLLGLLMDTPVTAVLPDLDLDGPSNSHPRRVGTRRHPAHLRH